MLTSAYKLISDSVSLVKCKEVSKMINTKLMSVYVFQVKCIQVSKMMNTKLMPDSVSIVKCLQMHTSSFHTLSPKGKVHRLAVSTA